MKTLGEKLIEDLYILTSKLSDFLIKYTRIKRSIYPEDNFLSVRGNYSCEHLPKIAIPTQNELYISYNKIFDIIEVLLADSVDSFQKEFKTQKAEILLRVVQDGYTFDKDITDAQQEVERSCKLICEILSKLFPKTTETPIIIADTNSLYISPNIEEWNFDNFNEFELIITPSVLKDLDKHKIEHRNPDIRSKALKIINKFKELRRRGTLTQGVVVKAGKISLRTIANEPNFTKTLKWLDPHNDDDRLIAEIIEIIKMNSHRPVFLITSDINLQNKCELIELPYCEPPEP